MPNAVNVALRYLKMEAGVIEGMVGERVHIGPIAPSRVSDTPHIVIIQNRNKGERIDDNLTRRHLKLTVSVLMRVDQVAGDADLQINDTYEPMHASFEQMIDGVEGIMLSFTEVEDSLEYDTEVFEGQAIRSATSDWILTIERTLGQTDLAS